MLGVASKEKANDDDTRPNLLSIEPETLESVNVHALMSKLHRSVLPICSLILVFANIDRGNLGFVANQLCSDLKLSHTQYGTGASAFFAGLLISRIPSNLAMRQFGAPFWLMAIMFTWGLLAACLAFITHVYHFYIVRFLLGLAEGGAFPGVWYYVTEFFPDDHLTYAYTIIALALPLATAFSGPLASMFMTLDGLFRVESWRYMFFIEGIIPALCALILYSYIPKSISQVRSLRPEERNWLQRRLQPAHKTSDRSLWAELRMLFGNRPYWILAVSGVMHSAVFAVILYWTALMIEVTVTPTASRDHETCASSNANSSIGMTVTSVVFILSALVTYVVGEVTQRVRNRGPPAAWLAIVAGIAIGTWSLMNTWSRLLGLLLLSIAVCTAHANSALFVGLLVAQFDPQIKSTALSVYACIASIGSLCGPILTGRLVDHYGDYNLASIAMGLLQIWGALLILTVPDPLDSPLNKVSH